MDHPISCGQATVIKQPSTSTLTKNGLHLLAQTFAPFIGCQRPIAHGIWRAAFPEQPHQASFACSHAFVAAWFLRPSTTCPKSSFLETSFAAHSFLWKTKSATDNAQIQSSFLFSSVLLKATWERSPTFTWFFVLFYFIFHFSFYFISNRGIGKKPSEHGMASWCHHWICPVSLVHGSSMVGEKTSKASPQYKESHLGAIIGNRQEVSSLSLMRSSHLQSR